MFKLLFVFLSVTANAVKIKLDCIRKHDSPVGTASDQGIAFDWTSEVIREFNSQSVPVLKRSCLSDTGDLNSFRIVMRGYDLSSNVLSNSAGPSEFGSCANKKSPVQDHPTKGIIWYDDSRI